MNDELTNAFKAFEVEYEYGVKKSADTIRCGQEELASNKEWQRLKSAMRSRQDENTELRALVKELTDALSQSVINHCYRCRFFRLKHTECKDKKNEVKCWSKSFKLLIEKSREVCK